MIRGTNALLTLHMCRKVLRKVDRRDRDAADGTLRAVVERVSEQLNHQLVRPSKRIDYANLAAATVPPLPITRAPASAVLLLTDLSRYRNGWSPPSQPTRSSWHGSLPKSRTSNGAPSSRALLWPSHRCALTRVSYPHPRSDLKEEKQRLERLQEEAGNIERKRAILQKKRKVRSALCASCSCQTMDTLTAQHTTDDACS